MIVILSIAGFDPSSGAGVTADVLTAAAHGCYAITCITALTVQNTVGVQSVHPVAPEVVQASLNALAQDFPIAAVRIGMLGSAAVADAVADFLETTRLPHVVLDPIIRASSGAELLDVQGLNVLRTRLFPLAEVITPNRSEAAVLAGVSTPPEEPRELARELHRLGARAVVITGGDLEEATDQLSVGGRDGDIQELHNFSGPRLDSDSTHGTGCAFATSIACALALGEELPDAVASAKAYVLEGIRSAETLGRGRGPINHLHPFFEE